MKRSSGLRATVVTFGGAALILVSAAVRLRRAVDPAPPAVAAASSAKIEAIFTPSPPASASGSAGFRREDARDRGVNR